MIDLTLEETMQLATLIALVVAIILRAKRIIANSIIMFLVAVTILVWGIRW